MPTQTANPLTDQVIAIIMNQMDLPKEQILPDSDFETDLGFDSLEQVEFIIAIEETFGIEVPDEDAEKIRTVQQAVARIEQSLR